MSALGAPTAEQLDAFQNGLHEAMENSSSVVFREAPEGPLDSNAKYVGKKRSPRPGKPLLNRTFRWNARAALWSLSSIKRVRHCGRYSTRPLGSVDLRKGAGEEGFVGFSGLQSCGSVWACPVCVARIQAERRVELEKLQRWADKEGFAVVFKTVTLRHRRGQSLEKLLGVLSAARRGVSQARRVRRLRDDLGVVGSVRTVEVTHGSAGWHPHVHEIVILRRKPSERQLAELRDAEFSVWEKQAVKRGLGAPMKRFYDVRLADLSESLTDYMVKTGSEFNSEEARKLAFELQGATVKRGRGSRTPWEILLDVVASGDAADLALWEEYEKATKGRRALVWSDGLKAMVGVDEVSDEEIAEEEEGSEEQNILTLVWETAREHGANILDAADSGGKDAVLEYCATHDVLVMEPDDPFAVEDRMLSELQWRERQGESVDWSVMDDVLGGNDHERVQYSDAG